VSILEITRRGRGGFDDGRIFRTYSKSRRAERVAVHLLSGLTRDAGSHLSLFAVTKENESTFLHELPAAVTKHHTNAKGPRALRLARLSRCVAQTRPDVLISHMTHANVYALMCRPSCRRSGTKTVIVDHTLPADTKLVTLPIPALRLICRRW